LDFVYRTRGKFGLEVNADKYTAVREKATPDRVALCV